MPNLTAEQQRAVRSIIKDVKSGEKITSLGGFAGTGKTTCMSVLYDVLNDFSVCAFTGKAASILRKKGMLASTIHSFIYKTVEDETGKLSFVLKFPDELACSGFLVDEASMVSKDLYEDLLSFDKPIVFVGDHGQLEPVGQNVNVMANPKYKLETIHRNAGEIAYFAEHIRKGGSPRTFQASEKVSFLSSVPDDMLISGAQMICAYNKTRVEKNVQVRKLLGHEKLVQPGDRVICLRNNKRKGLFNGMQGEVVSTHEKYPRMDFVYDDFLYQDIFYDPNQFGKEKNQFEFGQDTPEPFDYAYCVTCHKAQGDEWDEVIVFEQECDKWDHKRWAYTSASRAKEKLVWVAPKQYIPAWL